jgi:hypothetical protein
MAGRVPEDFNADWYQATYPDVALSGLRPQEHYRRFGRLMGRSPNGAAASRAEEAEAASPAPSDAGPLAAVETEAAGQVVELSPEGPAIIDRPADFDAAHVLPTTAPPRQGRDGNERISIETMAEGPFQPGDMRARGLDALASYARLFGLPDTAEEPDLELRVSCGAEEFQAGEARIENAWFADRSTLRLMLAGGTNTGAAASSLIIRAYQASPASPNDLSPLGEGIQLPAVGPVFLDLLLLHPFMPLLLELSDTEGKTRGIALMPFPSLLPGAVHWAELKAQQTEANPMDDFWSLSEALLKEAVGGRGWPRRSIGSIAVDRGSTESAVSLSSDVQEWLAAVFQLNLEARSVDPDNAANISRLSLHGPSAGLELSLPPDCMPTIGVLVSRRLGPGDRQLAPYLVAEADSHRPRWSVLLPSTSQTCTNVPILRSHSPQTGQAGEERGGAAGRCHIAIALRRPAPAIASRWEEEPTIAADDGGAVQLSVVLEASDGSRAGALLSSLRKVARGAPIEFLVKLPSNEDGLVSELNRNCGEGGWSAISPDTDLRDVAETAQNETLLVISDQVRLEDPAALGFLCALLEGDGSIGSVSCLLKGEKVIKKLAVLQPVSAGIFPSGVSFSTAPHLSFAEPDVFDALPELTYPVVANTLLMTLFRRRALAALPRPSAPVPPTALDIRIGLDLMDAGFGNWCTTKVSALLCGPHQRRDSIDPFGGVYVEPRRWADLLERVSLIRELF